MTPLPTTLAVIAVIALPGLALLIAWRCIKGAVLMQDVVDGEPGV